MEDINLHFTGDFHAIGAANNLLAALLDAHIHNGNELGIDVRKITWKRCVDMNDRQLRFITDGLGGRINGTPREDGFDITVASEIMAILCLASDITDLKNRLANIIVGYTYDDKPVTAGQLKAQGAAAALLKDALKPNLVQTLEGTPAFIHGGPFANIAHGCNSMIATKMARKMADYVVTEAGFGADLGAEKFLDIKCRMGEMKPDAVVIVATVRALKHHGGVAKEKLNSENLAALEKGDTLLDLYCGTGSVGICISDKETKLFGVEIVPEAAEDARYNAKLNSLNAEYICLSADTALDDEKLKALHPDVIAIDPPRKGCGTEAAAKISSLGARRIVYISCDPATLARDLAEFEKHGYFAVCAEGVDMFPRTAHVETIVLLQRRDT